MKKGMLILFALFFNYSINAQVNNKTSLLWKISGKGISKPSYLFGTFHIICKDDFIISDSLKQKLLATEMLFEEMKIDDPDLQMQMMLKLRSDTTIESLLDSAAFKKLAKQFQNITGISISFFNSYKPFMLSSMLAQKMISCKDAIQPETEFIKIVKKNNIPVNGLESVDDELSAIKKIPLDSQINTIIKMVNNFDSAKQMMQEMITIYKKRDPQALYSFMKTNGLDNDFETAMLAERNNKWLPIIIANIKKQASFFAFGAGHLSGENGIINLLKKQGYTVNPVAY